ncbi:GNAT family N-acetyltransferase [Alkalihalobacillus sp. FSL R5-0424]
MMLAAQINLPLEQHEVPDLREVVGWDRRDPDYPRLFERCLFWAGVKDDSGRLIAFGYLCGMGLEHGYMEDVIVHPDYQGVGIGLKIVNELLAEAERARIEIITVTFAEENTNFYERAGFIKGASGVWRLGR